MAHIENLREFKDGKTCYLAFDKDVDTVVKSFYEKSYDETAFSLKLQKLYVKRFYLLIANLKATSKQIANSAFYHSL